MVNSNYGNVLERMEKAVQKVRERLLRAAHALDQAGIPYAVIGGNAVMAWVATVDESAVRNTRDVDLLIRRGDLEKAKQALEAAGFHHRRSSGIDMFLDGAEGRARDAVHVFFSSEKVRPEYAVAAPGADETERFPEGMTVISLENLIRMKLTSFRLKDKVHLIDMIEVGLISEKDLSSLPAVLADRLRDLMNDPEVRKDEGID